MIRRRLLQGRMMRLAYAGALCLALWLIALGFKGESVLSVLKRFVAEDDGRYLLVAAVLLVRLNTFRALFLYLGWFYLGESFALSGRAVSRSWILPLVAIPCSYLLISMTPGYFVLDLGIPALFSILTVVIMHLSTREIRGWVARTLVIALLVFSFQWLDIAPRLTHWGFGRGELSLALKNLAILSDWEWVLDALGLGAFACSFIGGIASAALLIGSNLRDKQFRKIREQDRAIAILHAETVRNRGYLEVQQLVHDLRRPLTTMLGLADVLVATLHEGDTHQYAAQLVESGSHMNQMIEELLKEDSMRSLPVHKVVDYVLSQISAFGWRHWVLVTMDGCEGVRVQVNQMRFSRALVNLLDNAHMALQDVETPRIDFCISIVGERVAFCVEDNGRGFSSEVIPEKSQWGSSGLGLVFVQEVVKKHGGCLNVSNKPLGGGSVCITLFAVEGDK